MFHQLEEEIDGDVALDVSALNRGVLAVPCLEHASPGKLPFSQEPWAQVAYNTSFSASPATPLKLKTRAPSEGGWISNFQLESDRRSFVDELLAPDAEYERCEPISNVTTNRKRAFTASALPADRRRFVAEPAVADEQLAPDAEHERCGPISNVTTNRKRAIKVFELPDAPDRVTETRFLVDNATCLKSKLARGLAFRKTRRGWDLHKHKHVDWGSQVDGVSTDGKWLTVVDKDDGERMYLPFNVLNSQVLFETGAKKTDVRTDGLSGTWVYVVVARNGVAAYEDPSSASTVTAKKKHLLFGECADMDYRVSVGSSVWLRLAGGNGWVQEGSPIKAMARIFMDYPPTFDIISATKGRRGILRMAHKVPVLASPCDGTKPLFYAKPGDAMEFASLANVQVQVHGTKTASPNSRGTSSERFPTLGVQFEWRKYMFIIADISDKDSNSNHSRVGWIRVADGDTKLVFDID